MLEALSRSENHRPKWCAFSVAKWVRGAGGFAGVSHLPHDPMARPAQSGSDDLVAHVGWPSGDIPVTPALMMSCTAKPAR